MLESPNDFISLRCLVSSSASINKKVKLKLFDLLDCDFHEMYGATEVATATNLSQAYSLKKPTSVGVPCENVEVRIVDDSFLDKEIMEQGKIIIKSPLSSSGYYNLPDLTNSSFVSGYFVTGDLGFLDEDGFLYFTNREKDIIISGGENIYPSDIEFYINQHDLIEDSTVVSVNDDYFGEVPVAVIISIGCKNNKLIEREVRSFLRDNLLPNQQPMKYFFSEKFPLTLSGKLDKKKIQKDINELGLDLSAKLRQIKGICDE
jgi:acyl-CoA synthetase (AMP-forming)/AMP-acid ligase II